MVWLVGSPPGHAVVTSLKEKFSLFNQPWCSRSTECCCLEKKLRNIDTTWMNLNSKSAANIQLWLNTTHFQLHFPLSCSAHVSCQFTVSSMLDQSVWFSCSQTTFSDFGQQDWFIHTRFLLSVDLYFFWFCEGNLASACISLMTLWHRAHSE